MIIPPLPTPFDQNGHLDTEAFRDLAQAIEPHVDGLLFYGSNGEGVHLTREERAAGLAIQTPRKPAMVGLMEETLAQAAIALSEAESLGARVLVTPPRYYEANLGHDGLMRYFEGIADMGKAEVWLYHVPANTKAQLPLPVVAELAKHPNIGGLKDSSGELARMAFYASQKLALEPYTGHAPTFPGGAGAGRQGGHLGGFQLSPQAVQTDASALAGRQGRRGPGSASRGRALWPGAGPGWFCVAQASPAPSGPARRLPPPALPQRKPGLARLQAPSGRVPGQGLDGGLRVSEVNNPT